MMFGRSTLNAFQIARGYLPGIAGIPKKILTTELLNGYTKLSACRAIAAAVLTSNPKAIPISMLKKGDDIYVLYISTNKSIDVKWITAKIIDFEEHFVVFLLSVKGPPMRVAYAHIRLIPTTSLARKTTETYMEDDILVYIANS